MNTADSEKLLKSIEPKSDQLNAEDLLCGPITVTIDGVLIGDNDQQPVTIGLVGKKPYKPCKTMRRLLIVLWGADATAWIGRRLTLYCDQSVRWAGTAVGGIRISHMSDIGSEPKTMMLSESKGKRKAVTVYPLQAVTEPAKPTLLDEWRPKFAGAPDDVLAIAKAIAQAWTDRDRGSAALSPVTTDIEQGWLNRIEQFQLAVVDSTAVLEAE